MKQQQTNKHSNLHREDQHITIEELWRGWKSSEGLCVLCYCVCVNVSSSTFLTLSLPFSCLPHFSVHNWTQDAVLRWLREFVELPQYEKNFKDIKVNGNTLPR